MNVKPWECPPGTPFTFVSVVKPVVGLQYFRGHLQHEIAVLQAYRDKLGTPPDVTCATTQEDKFS